MYAQVEKPKENKSRATANSVTQKKSNGKQGAGFADNRPETKVQRKSQSLADNRMIHNPIDPIQRRVLMVENNPDWIMLRNADVLSKNKGGGKIQHLASNPSLADVNTGEFLYLVGHGNSEIIGGDTHWSPQEMAGNLHNLGLPQEHRHILLSGVCNSASGEESFAEVLKITLTNAYGYVNSVVIGAVGLAIAGFHDGWQDTVVKPENQKAELALENKIKIEEKVSAGIEKAKKIISSGEIPNIAERAAIISQLVGPFYVRLAEEHAKNEGITFDSDDPNARKGFYS